MPKLFAISDPHLSFNTPNKSMDKFGEIWVDHTSKIKQHWTRLVSEEDVVAVPGDISWARKFDQAKADLNWLHHLPGTKIILRGNHDFWWMSSSKLKMNLPSSIKFIHNNSVCIGPFEFFGSRLWDTQEYSLESIIDWDPKKGDLPEILSGSDLDEQEKQYQRELDRLNISISSLPKKSDLIRIGLCHYPPLGVPSKPSRASDLFKDAGARHVIFGHLHSVKNKVDFSPEVDGLKYHLTSCDYLNHKPKLIIEV